MSWLVSMQAVKSLLALASVLAGGLVWFAMVWFSETGGSIKHLSYLDQLIESDLHFCSGKSLIEQDNHINTTVRSHKRLTTYTRVLKGFVPAQYSPQFRNPCWFSTMTVPKNVFKTLTNISVLKSPVYSDKQAVWLTKNILNTNSGNKENLYCLPSVYLAGFPKCATTTLYRIITAHPSLAQPLHKESHFWKTFVQNWMKYPHKLVHTLWYLLQYSSASRYIEAHPDALTLDASASTLWTSVPSPSIINTTQMHSHDNNWCLISQMVSTVTPDAKFIVIMRDPVKRLFSDFWYFCANHNWRNSKGEVTVPQTYQEHAPEIFHNYTVQVIREYVTCVKSSASEFECVGRATRGVGSEKACFPLRVGLGMYYFHIVQWLNVFPMKQFLFLRTEDLDRDPHHSAVMVWKFLGVRPLEKTVLHRLWRRANEMSWIKTKEYRDKFQMLPETEEILRLFYRPYNERLARLLRDNRFLWAESNAQD